MSRRLTSRSLAIAKANTQAGVDAALTIAARTQSLLAPGGGGFEKAREAQLMVQEKDDADVEGVRTPHDLSAGLTAIAEAAAGPARRKVRANARRLTGAKAFR